DQSINQSKITKNLSQNEVHSDPDLILYNPSVLIDKEPYLSGSLLIFLPKTSERSGSFRSLGKTQRFSMCVSVM
ncbi:hypothetical protein SE904_09140, partial [Enterococcus faecium]|nr:hypothetical protein [Enterococcus faecium]MDW0318152.1 hypothetical protein [Enterococcus faecium]MDW8822494.1 hypothetical protein [Enterococcus faecium]